VFESLCHSLHKELVCGRCPWCGCFIVHGLELPSTDDLKITEMVEVRLAAIEAIPHPRSALKHADAGIRALAAKYLGEIGPSAKEALPDLSLLLQDTDQQVRDAAKQAIKTIEKQG
jgi:HEAT repeat protein